MFINMVITTKNMRELIISFLFILMVTLSPAYAQNMDNFANSTTNNSKMPFLAGELRVKPDSSNDEDFLCASQYQKVSAGYSFDQVQAPNVHIFKDHFVKIGNLVGWTLGAYNTGPVPVV